MIQQSMLQKYDAAIAQAMQRLEGEEAQAKKGLAEDIKVALRQLMERGYRNRIALGQHETAVTSHGHTDNCTVTYHYEDGKVYRKSPEFIPTFGMWFYNFGTGKPKIIEIDPKDVPFEEFKLWGDREENLHSVVMSIEDALKSTEVIQK